MPPSSESRDCGSGLLLLLAACDMLPSRALPRCAVEDADEEEGAPGCSEGGGQALRRT